MGMKLVNEQIFQDIADAIRNKINSEDFIQVSQMPNKIREISSETIRIEPKTEIISSYRIDKNNKYLLKFDRSNNFNQILSFFIVNQENSDSNEYVECFYGYSFYDEDGEPIYCGYFCSKNLNNHEVYFIDSGAFSISKTEISIEAPSNITQGWYNNSSNPSYKIILTYIPD